MGLSESEYQRIVAELKGGKSHVLGEQEQINQRMLRLDAVECTECIGGMANFEWIKARLAREKNPATPNRDLEAERVTQARGREIKVRAYAMGQRCKALTAFQVTQALSDTAHRLAMQFHRTRDSSHPLESYGRALDDIERELQIAEQRAR